MKKGKHRKDLMFIALILILVLVMLYCGLQILESTVLSTGQGSGETVASKTVTYNGVDYFPRQDITVVMVLGIDQYGPVEDSGTYTNPGAADMVALVILDEQAESVSMLYLNRDTMLSVPVLGIGGKQAGTWFGQLALAHTYGSGLADSCESTRKAVSDFLGGLHIDYYVSMNMDAIAILNDAVGGVTVNVTEDFSQVDETITLGELTLNGQQAINYVRTRKDVGDQLNLSRIERQKEYLTSFGEALAGKLESDGEFAVRAYEQVSQYIVTDCSAATISGLMSRYSNYAIGQIVTPQGENVMGETYYEFYADETALWELVLSLFYAPK